MTPIYTPGTAQFELVLQSGAYIAENVFHVTSNAAWDVAALQAVEAQIVAWWNTNLKSIVHSQWSLIKVVGLDVSQAGGATDTYITGLPIAGLAGAVGLPGNVTVAIKWNTGMSGRSFRGRTFHVGLQSAQITNVAQSLTTAAQTAIQAAYAALIAAIAATAGHKLAIVSKRHNGAWRVAGVATTVTNCSVEVNIDSQRRRLAGRGRA